MREATSCRVRVGSTSRQSDKKVDWGGWWCACGVVWRGLAWFGCVVDGVLVVSWWSGKRGLAHTAYGVIAGTDFASPAQVPVIESAAKGRQKAYCLQQNTRQDGSQSCNVYQQGC